jgi:hypothetical protein
MMHPLHVATRLVHLGSDVAQKDGSSGRQTPTMVSGETKDIDYDTTSSKKE